MSTPVDRQAEPDAEKPGVRAWVMDELRPFLPADWLVIDYLDETTAIRETTVMLALDGFEHQGQNYLVTHDLFVLLPSDPTPGGQAEGAIDDALMDVLARIDASERIRWTRAQRGVSDADLFYRVTLESLQAKKPKE